MEKEKILNLIAATGARRERNASAFHSTPLEPIQRGYGSIDTGAMHREQISSYGWLGDFGNGQRERIGQFFVDLDPETSNIERNWKVKHVTPRQGDESSLLRGERSGKWKRRIQDSSKLFLPCVFPDDDDKDDDDEDDDDDDDDDCFRWSRRENKTVRRVLEDSRARLPGAGRSVGRRRGDTGQSRCLDAG